MIPALYPLIFDENALILDKKPVVPGVIEKSSRKKTEMATGDLRSLSVDFRGQIGAS